MPLSERILFVDNNPDFVTSRIEFLTDRYEVLIANSIEQAEYLLHTQAIDLAIFDIRMRDDHDLQDTSGLDLAREALYRPLPKIMFTNYPDYEFVRKAMQLDALGQPASVNFIAKHEGGVAMREAVDAAFAEHVRINHVLEVDWNAASMNETVALLVPQSDHTHLHQRALELEALFRKAFYDQTSISLSRKITTHADQVLLEFFVAQLSQPAIHYLCVCRPRTLDPVQPGQLIGRLDFNLYIQQESIHFVLQVYSLVGERLDTTMLFRHYYEQKNPAEIAGAIQHLFKLNLAQLHRTERGTASLTTLAQTILAKAGNQQQALSMTAASQRLQTLCKHALWRDLDQITWTEQQLTWQFSDSQVVQLLNPLVALVDQTLSPAQVTTGLTHGQLDSNLMLVNGQGQTWLLPVTIASNGILLSDFVALELAIKLEVGTTLEMSQCYQLEQQLCEATALDHELGSELPQLQRALSTLTQIRRAAAATPNHTLNAYLTVMLFQALQRAISYNATHPGAPRQMLPFLHSLLIAAVIYNHLKLGLQPSPPPLHPTDHLWLDIENERLHIDSNIYLLTEQEFVIVKYLYRHAGQLCSRKDIIEQVFGLQDDQAEHNRLNTAISRLRRKIEIDSDKPKYLVSIRSRGYQLNKNPAPTD